MIAFAGSHGLATQSHGIRQERPANKNADASHAAFADGPDTYVSSSAQQDVGSKSLTWFDIATLQDQVLDPALAAWLGEVLTAKQLHPSQVMGCFAVVELERTRAMMGEATSADPGQTQQLAAHFHHVFEHGVRDGMMLLDDGGMFIIG